MKNVFEKYQNKQQKSRKERKIIQEKITGIEKKLKKSLYRTNKLKNHQIRRINKNQLKQPLN